MTKKIKVMMIDDEKRFRETTQKILTKKGFDTLVAKSGEDALATLEMTEPDLMPDVIILDIKMPGMDGHEALRRIKAITPVTPVIMLTGHGDRPSAAQALSHGAFDYLSKPCDIDILAEKIKEAQGQSANGFNGNERPLTSVMIPLAEYTTISEDKTVQEAIHKLKHSFQTKMATRQIMETGHRSILVTDKQGKVLGILTIRDLMEAVMPNYLKVPKPSLADTIEYSPMFWKGMFTTQIRQVQNMAIHEIMSPSPLCIDAGASLMEAAFCMVSKDQTRLIVTESDQSLGIIREQDLFFEMAKQLTA